MFDFMLDYVVKSKDFISAEQNSRTENLVERLGSMSCWMLLPNEDN